jgi:hypothetical protein
MCENFMAISKVLYEIWPFYILASLSTLLLFLINFSFFSNCKDSVSYEQFRINLLKFKSRLSQPQTHPNVSIIKGFDPARQWYFCECLAF